MLSTLWRHWSYVALDGLSCDKCVERAKLAFFKKFNSSYHNLSFVHKMFCCIRSDYSKCRFIYTSFYNVQTSYYRSRMATSEVSVRLDACRAQVPCLNRRLQFFCSLKINHSVSRWKICCHYWKTTRKNIIVQDKYTLFNTDFFHIHF